MIAARAPLRPTTLMHADQSFPVDISTRMVARRLYERVRALPILWFDAALDPQMLADNRALRDPARLFVSADATVVRVLSGHGIAPGELGVGGADGAPVEGDSKEIWRRFAENYHLFRGTSVRLWHDHVFSSLFGLSERLALPTADLYYDRISESLAKPDLLPRALWQRAGLEAVAIAASPLDDLSAFTRPLGIKGRVIPTYAADALVDPLRPDFADQLFQLGALTGCDMARFDGYLEGHRKRRAAFKAAGAVASEMTWPPVASEPLPEAAGAELFARVAAGAASPAESFAFRGVMALEMARLSLEDGLALRLRAGAPAAGAGGRDLAGALRPLLARFGHAPKFVLVVACEDLADARALAALADGVSCLRIAAAGPLARSPEGLRSFRAATMAEAGFYKTVVAPEGGGLLSVAARSDLARRMDCAVLAELVAAHRMDEAEAFDLAQELAYGLAKRCYRL